MPWRNILKPGNIVAFQPFCKPDAVFLAYMPKMVNGKRYFIPNYLPHLSYIVFQIVHSFFCDMNPCCMMRNSKNLIILAQHQFPVDRTLLMINRFYGIFFDFLQKAQRRIQTTGFIQQKLDTLHGLNASLPDPALSAAMDRMEKAGRSIVEAVEANPAKAKQVRRFANYYLPDAVNILQQYATLARQGVKGENAAAIRTEVEHNAASIATAFENQLDALYAAESMDLSADLTVLQNMLKGQGL